MSMMPQLDSVEHFIRVGEDPTCRLPEGHLSRWWAELLDAGA
jgi:hypothetical protein